MIKKKPSKLNIFFRNLFWFAYSGIIASYIIDYTYNFFAPESPIPLFYKIMYYYFPLYYIKYMVDLSQTIATSLLLIPLFLYIFGIKFLPKIYWKVLLFLQIILSIAGNTYPKIQLKSFYLEGGIVFWIMAYAIIILYAPLYYAVFRYAFSQENKPPPKA